MNSRHLFNSLCCCLLFILCQNRIYTNGLNQTTLMLRNSHFYVGLVRSQNQVPSHYMNLLFHHEQHFNGPFAFVVVQIPVQLEKKVVDNVFQCFTDHVSRQNLIDPFVFLQIEYDPTFSPLSGQVHFEPVHNMERMIRDPSKEKNKIVSSILLHLTQRLGAI